MLLPEGYVYSCRNMLFDKLGVPRKRGGILGVGATTTYQGDHILAYALESGALRVYASQGAGAAIYYIDTTTGAYTSLNPGSFTSALVNEGRGFTHYGFVGFPGWQPDTTLFEASTAWVAGATGAVADHTFGTPTSVVVTAGDKRIVCAAGDSPTTLLQVGQIFEVLPNGANVTSYIGRVTRLVSTTAFEVYPTPPVSMTGAAVLSARAFAAGSGQNTASAIIGSKLAMSFQGRVVLANISRETVAPSRVELYPRRVWFSSTLLEGDTMATALNVVSGAVWLTPHGYPDLNYFDIPAQEAITAITPTGSGEALIFTGFRAYRLTGNLSTQYGTEQSITWAPREIPNSVGCMSERSLQRTPRGVIFAHDSGVYTTDGNSMQPIMYKRIANYWNTLAQATDFTIYGSALVRGNHYFICGVSNSLFWALMVNLDTLAWGPISGKANAPASFLLNSAAQDPTNPTRCWGLKWYGQGGAVSMPGGQLVKLDTMFTPSSANRADSDNTNVTYDLTTMPYTENSPTLQKTWYDATVEYNNAGGASVAVTPGFVIDSADMATVAAGPTGLDQQDVYTVTAASNAIPIVLTIGSHGLRIDSWVRVAGVTGNTAANGLYRVQAVSGTTITLMGSSGNAAWISGGTVRAVDQRDISLLNQALVSTNTGQSYAAVAYKFSDSLGSDSFEILGITHTWEDRDDPSE